MERNIPPNKPCFQSQARSRHLHVLLVACKRFPRRVDALLIEGARRARRAGNGAVDQRQGRPVKQFVAQNGHIHREGTVGVKLCALQLLADMVHQRLLPLGPFHCW